MKTQAAAINFGWLIYPIGSTLQLFVRDWIKNGATQYFWKAKYLVLKCMLILL